MSFGKDKVMVDTLLKLKEKFNYNIFVETGTGMGWTIKTLQPYFKKIYSCEINQSLWVNYDLFINNSKIEIKLGSSIEWLPIFFNEIGDDNFFLYLDAHNLETNPILDELRIVSEFNFKPIIIIHDFDNGKQFLHNSTKNLSIKNKTLLGDFHAPIPLDFNFVKDSIDNIYGKDKYIFETNTRCEEGKVEVGCAYFYPKN